MVAGGFAAPVAMAASPDNSGRLLVADQTGVIWVVRPGQGRLPTPFLDIADRLVELRPFYDERGLLGLAFDPDFASNGRFYVLYNAPPSDDVENAADSVLRLSEFTMADPSSNQADAATERILLRIGKPQYNHNGGQLAVGPDDGLLYMGVGDGGGAGDTSGGHTPGLGNGQDTTTLLGKILRIDVTGGEPYGIPPDNPFADADGGLPEIYAYGFRNPWRFSFDVPDTDRAASPRLFVGDVGQNAWEEVSLVESGGNYGWRIREGTHCFNPPADCPSVGAGGEPLVPPIIEYPHSDPSGGLEGISVIGGYVYRGAAIDSLRGAYVFGDLDSGGRGVSGSVFVAIEKADGSWSAERLAIANSVGGSIFSFGKDREGELYVLAAANTTRTGGTGVLYRLAPAE